MPIKISAAEDAVKQRVFEKLAPEINEKLEQISREIHKRTYIYAGLGVYGLFLAFAPLPQILFYILCGLMLAALFYLLWRFAQTARKIVRWMDNFERLLKQEVKKRAQKTKENANILESFVSVLSGLEDRDIEDICISQTVRALAKRFKRKKWHLLARIGAFAAVIIFLQKAAEQALRNLL